ncbi:MAG: SH3 domain-containing protein [bacterium]
MDQFLEANKAFELGNYEKAREDYTKIVGQGITNGKLFYNLGNTCVRLGKIGDALLYYRKAEQWIPRDGDLKFNINYVLGLTKDKIESRGSERFINLLFFWYNKFSLTELLYIFLGINLIFWSSGIALHFKKNEFIKSLWLLSLAVNVIMGSTLITKAYLNSHDHQGVVIENEIIVRSGYGVNNSVLFKLHEGAEFKVLDKTEGWFKIVLSDGKIGWIEGRFVGII